MFRRKGLSVQITNNDGQQRFQQNRSPYQQSTYKIYGPGGIHTAIWPHSVEKKTEVCS